MEADSRKKLEMRMKEITKGYARNGGLQCNIVDEGIRKRSEGDLAKRDGGLSRGETKCRSEGGAVPNNHEQVVQKQ